MSNHLSPDSLEAWAQGRGSSDEERRHLDACLECAKTARAMEDYFAALKSLPERKAPSGFAARLRARIDAEAQAPWWRKMFSAAFFPIRIKIPLQLAGAGFAALLLFWALPQYRMPPSDSRVPSEEDLESTETATPLSDGEAKPVSPGAMPEPVAPSKEKRDQRVTGTTTPEPPLPPVPEELTLSKGAHAPAKVPGAGYASRSGRAVSSGDDNVAMIESKAMEAESPAGSKAKSASRPAPAMAAKKFASPKPSENSLAALTPKEEKSEGSGAVAGSVSGLEDAKAPAADREIGLAAQPASPPAAAVRQEFSPNASQTEAPNGEAALKKLGFTRKSNPMRWVLRTSKSKADSLVVRLNSGEFEKRVVVRPISTDSAEIEVR